MASDSPDPNPVDYKICGVMRAVMRGWSTRSTNSVIDWLESGTVDTVISDRRMHSTRRHLEHLLQARTGLRQMDNGVFTIATASTMLLQCEYKATATKN